MHFYNNKLIQHRLVLIYQFWLDFAVMEWFDGAFVDDDAYLIKKETVWCSNVV